MPTPRSVISMMAMERSARTVTVTDSSVSGNLGQGYWSDVSVYDTRILNSNVVGNRAAGVFLEISARGTVANNIISDNELICRHLFASSVVG